MGEGEGVCLSGDYLVLLREAQTVVGFEPLDVVGQLAHGDGRMFSHSWRRERERRKVLSERDGYHSSISRLWRQGDECEGDECEAAGEDVVEMRCAEV